MAPYGTPFTNPRLGASRAVKGCLHICGATVMCPIHSLIPLLHTITTTLKDSAQ